MRTLLEEKHVTFLKRCLDVLPDAYEQLDTSRLTLLYFVLSGLDILNALEEITAARRQCIVKWIYSMQIGYKNGCSGHYGFRGSPTHALQPKNKSFGRSLYDEGHLAMTYSALTCLTILNDDFGQVDRQAIICGIKSCQQEDGSFCGCLSGSESDMRFVYCAVASCHMLKEERCFDEDKLLFYIRNCLNYDGGFGQTPGTESHGGATYCAIATLHLLGKLECDTVLSGLELDKLKKWCIFRQNEGFFGRPNKPDDSCYTFWIGATLKLLNCPDCIDVSKAVAFTLLTQDAEIGGFGKYPDMVPDLLHTYLSLAGLSLLNVDNLRSINPALNVTLRSLIERKPSTKNHDSLKPRCSDDCLNSNFYNRCCNT